MDVMGERVKGGMLGVRARHWAAEMTGRYRTYVAGLLIDATRLSNVSNEKLGRPIRFQENVTGYPFQIVLKVHYNLFWNSNPKQNVVPLRWPYLAPFIKWLQLAACDSTPIRQRDCPIWSV